MKRFLIHKTRVEEFIEWMDSNDIPHRPGRGVYQILQILKDERHWCCLWWKHGTRDYYTVDRRIEYMVRRFNHDRKQPHE